MGRGSPSQPLSSAKPCMQKVGPSAMTYSGVGRHLDLDFGGLETGQITESSQGNFQLLLTILFLLYPPSVHVQGICLAMYLGEIVNREIHRARQKENTILPQKPFGSPQPSYTRTVPKHNNPTRGIFQRGLQTVRLKHPLGK